MQLQKFIAAAGLSLGMTCTPNVQATVITFDGGAISSGNTIYQESGFQVKTIGGTATFNNYYGGSNNVIHAHWSSGDYGSVTKIVFSKIDGTAFDLNYFILTSNTDTGGSTASGNEQAFIHASDQVDGSTSTYSQLLPSENWGFPTSQIFLGSQFDNVKSFWFDVANAVDCFGMDSFFINEAAPPNPNDVPEPSTLALMSLSLLTLAIRRRGTKTQVLNKN